jgi:integrase/recombinase XerD
MKKLPIKSTSFQYLEISFKEWLDVLGYAPTSVYGMPNNIRELFYYLEQNGIDHITQLEIKHIKEYYNELKTRPNITRGGGLSNAYLNKHQQALIKFTEYLRKTGKIILPNLNLRKEEEQRKEITTLTPEEVQELYKAAGNVPEYTGKSKRVWLYEKISIRDKAMLSVFYGCGLRRNEGVQLNIDDINWERSILHVKKGKNYKERFVPFSAVNKKYLQDYLYESRPYFSKDNSTESFFISQKGKRMQGQSLMMRLKIVLKRTGNVDIKQKEITLHTLRHSIATHLMQAGMKIENISQFLGHSSLESTQIYTHLKEEENEIL